MTRRTHIQLLAAVAASTTVAAAKESSNMFQSILEASMNEKKGVNLWVKGQAIPGLVTKINADNVEMRSREYGRIVVRLDSIDGAAIA